MTIRPVAAQRPPGSRAPEPTPCARHLQAVLVALLLTMASSSSGTTNDNGPRRGGVLQIALEGDQRTLDPIGIFSGHEGMLAALIHESLLDYTAQGQFIPGLAADLPGVSHDGRFLDFRLRADARFANGRTVTAQDVVYSLERCLDPNQGAIGGFNFHGIRGAARFEAARRREKEEAKSTAASTGRRWIEPVRLEGIQITDPDHVRIELDQPNPYTLHVLASPVSAIVPREEVEGRETPFGTRPIGAGPFLLTKWTRGVLMLFERNPHYHSPARQHLDGFSVAVGIDLTTQAMLLERGELDLMTAVTDVDYLRFRRNPGLRSRIDSLPGVLPHFVALNCEVPPFTNRMVRLALSHAVDREAILKALFSRGTVARGPLAPSVRGFDPGLSEYPLDPARARALLAEAGYPQGFETELWVTRENTQHAKIALMIQEQLGAVGVKARIQEASGSSFNELTQRRGRVPMAVANWGATFDDPRDTLELLSGQIIKDEACLNIAFYSHAEVDDLFRRAAEEADDRRRLDLYREAEKQIVRDAPWIFLVHLADDHLRQPWVRGYRHRPIWPNARLDACWIER